MINIKNEGSRSRRTNKAFVDNACDLIADYLYHETGRDAVDLSEIKEFIYNDVCDDELHDYEPTKNEIVAIVKQLRDGGYKVNSRR